MLSHYCSPLFEKVSISSSFQSYTRKERLKEIYKIKPNLPVIEIKGCYPLKT